MFNPYDFRRLAPPPEPTQATPSSEPPPAPRTLSQAGLNTQHGLFLPDYPWNVLAQEQSRGATVLSLAGALRPHRGLIVFGPQVETWMGSSVLATVTLL